jgi:hypothetical protein
MKITILLFYSLVIILRYSLVHGEVTVTTKVNGRIIHPDHYSDRRFSGRF